VKRVKSHFTEEALDHRSERAAVPTTASADELLPYNNVMSLRGTYRIDDVSCQREGVAVQLKGHANIVS
jgi:hypothetical protein